VPFLQWLTGNDVKPTVLAAPLARTRTVACKQLSSWVGRLRVGFENSFWIDDGSLASDNAERVAEIRKAIDEMPT